MVNYDIPFFENTDDTHCYQACLKMALKYFKPDVNYSFDQLDEISQKEDGKPTWPMAGLCWLVDNGFDVVEIEKFDYDRFLKDGYEYLREIYDQDVMDYGKQTDELMVKKWTKEFLTKCRTLNKVPDINDVTELLDDGYLVIAQINWRKLHNKAGYVGHKVLVKGYTEKELIIHDPGLPSKENLRLPFNVFIEAWLGTEEVSAIKFVLE